MVMHQGGVTMIVETVLRFCSNLLITLFGAFEVISLPFDMINTLYSIICYGTWVVGTDILAIFAASVIMWWGVNASLGIALWVYDKLPFV